MSKAKTGRCPICGQPEDPRAAPFCSARCRQVDLSRWLKEVYVIPGEETVPPAGGGEIDEE